ncbi:MAG: hypothetical protein NXI01_09705 [Gammaproteobacteria bacterium]|nr:hypothetical protein [Gammaproteobacteria bacterium]
MKSNRPSPHKFVRASSTLPNSIQFYDNTIPLEAGDYEITVTPTLSIPGATGDAVPIAQPFTIQGPRFTVPNEDIHVQSPAPQSSGEFDTQLPHIIFNQRALPWERRLSKTAEKKTPWLALLVFEDNELVLPDSDSGSTTTRTFTTTVSDFITPSSTVIPKFDIPISDEERAMTCQTIRFSATLFQQIAPTLDADKKIDELALLAHCRSTLNETASDDYAVVLANRFPKAIKGCYVEILLQMPTTNIPPDGYILSKNAAGTWQLVYINQGDDISAPIVPDTIETVVPGYTSALNTLISTIGDNNPAELSRYQTASIKNMIRTYHNNTLPPENRIRPINNIAHLVSLEGCEAYLSEAYTPQSSDIIELISLSSWSFTCLPEMDQDFGALLTNLMSDTKTGDNVPLLRFSPSSADVATARSKEQTTTPEVLNYLENGYTPHLYHTFSGETTMGWYRGPLTPVKTTPIPAFYAAPQNSMSSTLLSDSTNGEDLLIYNKTTGVFDVSYACAWQIGKQLALADETFAENMLAFFAAMATTANQSAHQQPTKNELIGHLQNGLIDTISTLARTNQKAGQSARFFENRPERIKQNPQERRAGHLAMLQTIPEITIPENITRWLAQLRYFVGLPFAYLIPEETLLPVESIRFFHIDMNWLDAMIAGALTTGIHSSSNKYISSMMFEQLKKQGFGQKDPVCGFFLRSQVVSGWPNLLITTNDDIPDATPVNIVSSVRLAPDVLFCLFDGIPKQLSIGEPHQQLSFGISGDTIETGFVTLRNLIGDIGGFLNPNKQADVHTVLRPGNQRVINFDALTSLFTNQGVSSSSAGGTFSPSDMAIELIRAPEKVTFTLPSNPQLMQAMQAYNEISNETKAQADTTTLLTYAINTLPTPPVEVTEPVTLEVVINNMSPSEVVYLQEVAILLKPLDTSLPVLTDDPTKFSCTVTPSDVWHIENKDGMVTITPLHAKKEKPKSQAITNNGISIQLSGATVNAQIGTCYINIAEITTDANGDNSVTRRIPVPGISIVKTLNGFSLSDFAVTPAAVSPDSSVSLSWNIQRIDGCTVSLAWDGQSIDVTNVSTYSVSASDMSDSTVFTLTAQVPTSSGNVPVQKQVAATVKRPAISNFIAQSDKLYVGHSETLTWSTQYISHCTLMTSAGFVIVDNIQPDQHGVCTCPISPQRTTTYYVQAYDIQGHLSVQSTHLTVPVHKIEEETPVKIFPPPNCPAIINSIQLSPDEQSLFISYMIYMPASGPLSAAVINYIGIYNTNTKEVAAPSLKGVTVPPLIDPPLLITGFLKQGSVAYAFSFNQILILDVDSNTVQHTVKCPTPPDTSKSCWDRISNSKYNQACLVKETLYVWSETNAYCWEMNTQTFDIKLVKLNINQAPKGAVWAIVNPAPLVRGKIATVSCYISVYNNSIYGGTNTTHSITLNRFLSVTGFLNKDTLVYAFSGAQILVCRSSMNSSYYSIHHTIVCQQPPKQYQPSDVQEARLIGDTIYYWWGSNEFCWQINTNTNSITTAELTPDQAPEGLHVTFNQKTISTTTNQIYQISNDAQSVTVSDLKDVLIPESSTTTEISSSHFTQFSTTASPNEGHNTDPPTQQDRLPSKQENDTPPPKHCCTIS